MSQWPASLNKGALPLAFVVLVLQGWRTISHADFWTHLASGRAIATSGIPRTNAWTQVAADAPWVNVYWLYDRLLYGIWSLGGAPLVTLTHVLAVVGAFALAARACRRFASPAALAMALLLSVWLLAPRFDARPALIGILFAASFIFVLQDRPLKPTTLGILLPLQWLWTNMDPSFVWGPVILVLYTIETVIRPTSGGLSKALPWSAIFLLALCAVTVVSPYGLGLHRTLLAGLAGPGTLDWISPVSPQFSSNFTKHMVTLTLALGAAGLLMRKERLPLALTALAILSAFFMVRSLPNHLVLFTLLAFPFFALCVQSIGDFIQSILRAKPNHQAIARTAYAPFFILLFALSIWALLGNRFYSHAGHFSHTGLGVSAQLFPKGAHPVIEHPDFPERWLHLPMDGGYLAWAHPDRRAFINQRGAVYPPEIYTTLAQSLAGSTSAWARIEQDWQPEAVVLNNTWPLAADAVSFLTRQLNWQTVFFDGTTTVLLHPACDAPDLLAQAPEFLATGLASLEAQRQAYASALQGWRRPPLSSALIGGGAIFHQRGFYREAVACNRLLARGAPGFLSARLNLGIGLARLDKLETAIQTLEDLLPQIPNDSLLRTATQINLGIAYVQANRPERAARLLNQVVAAQPENALVWLWLSRAYERMGQPHDARHAIDQARALNPRLTEAFLQE